MSLAKSLSEYICAAFSGLYVQTFEADEALREIAEKKLDITQLREELVSNNQKLLQKDILENETDSPDLLAGIKEEMESMVAT